MLGSLLREAVQYVNAVRDADANDQRQGHDVRRIEPNVEQSQIPIIQRNRFPPAAMRARRTISFESG
jgi:hypothetical protein